MCDSDRVTTMMVERIVVAGVPATGEESGPRAGWTDTGAVSIIEVLRVRHCSRLTEEAYVHWVRRYIDFHHHEHPRQLPESHVNRFLTHLAVREHVAASTQNQALSAALFL